MEVMVVTHMLVVVTRMPVVVILCMTEDNLTLLLEAMEVGQWEVRDPWEDQIHMLGRLSFYFCIFLKIIIEMHIDLL